MHEFERLDEWAAQDARLDDGTNGALAHALDRRQSEADVVAHDREVGPRFIDIRRQDGDAELARFLDVLDELVRLILDRGHQRGQVFARKVGFEVGRLVRDPTVRDGVSFGEPVTRERLDEAEGFLGDIAAQPALDRAGDEFLAVARDLVLLFLAHHLAQLVRLGHREARDLARDLHDLFLVCCDSVGRRQDRLQLGMHILRRGAAVLVADVLRNPFHRTRAVQRDQRDDVVKRRRPQLGNQAPHALGLQLEDAGRLTPPEHLERLAVVVGNLRQVEFGSSGSPNLVHRVLHHGQVA